MNTYDHYTETQKLAALLRKEDLGAFADVLINAMQEGATGTEILMALRWNIKKIIDTEKCSRMTEAKANRLYRELDKSLR